MATKTTARDANRRIEFEEGGKGVQLLLTNAGVRVLHSTYGKEHVRIVNEGFMTADIGVIEKLLELMPHKGDEKVDVPFDDLDNLSLQDLTDKLRDAWSLAIHGMTFDEQMEHIQKLIAEQGDKPDESPLLTSPAAGSDTSSEQPSGQA